MKNIATEKLTIEYIIEYSGLNNREFADTYNIPLPTLGTWQRNGSCKEYVLELLYDKVLADKSYQSDKTAGKFFNQDFLKNLGYCYEGLQQLLGNEYRDNMAAIFPVKYFLLAYLEYGCTMSAKKRENYLMADPLGEKMQTLCTILSDPKYEGAYDYALPMTGRKYFKEGQELYKKEWLEEIKKIKMDLPRIGKDIAVEMIRDMTQSEKDALLNMYITADIEK